MNKVPTGVWVTPIKTLTKEVQNSIKNKANGKEKHLQQAA